MPVKTKSKVRTKVIAAVATVAILAGAAGVMNQMAKSRGFAFGWPIISRTAVKTSVKTPVKTSVKTAVKNLKFPAKPVINNVKPMPKPIGK